MNDQTKPGEAQKLPTPRWKKALIIVAGLLVVVGGGLKIHGMVSRSGKAPTAAQGGGATPQGAHGIVSGTPGGSSGAPVTESQDTKPGIGEKASPFLLSGGISFFAGLAVGTVLRMFFKIALLLGGIVILAIVGLSYANVIGPIDWQGLENWMNTRIEEAEKKTAGFRDFLLVSLPSAGMAGAGVVSGFKKK
jgi:uncharacterized membrane protein (Fun14 family)